MNISIKNGQPTIKLTKAEVRTLLAAHQILECLKPYDKLNVSADELGMTIKKINDEGEFVQ